ncbi:MAG: hypothetical protein ABI165_04855 [Bryobacteraceae bacterium]
MRATIGKPVIAALVAAIAFGQPSTEKTRNREFHFTQPKTAPELREPAAVFRVIAEIPQVIADDTQNSLALRGTDGQLALADWLFHELDTQGQSYAMHEYRMPSGGDDVVRVFYLTDAATVQGFQEACTVVRSIGEIRGLVTYNGTRAVVVRGAAAQIALADWMFNELDKPGHDASVHEFRMTGAVHNTVRVFYLPQTGAVQDFQKAAIRIRSKTKIPRLFTYNAPRAIAVRGTAEQIAMVGHLIEQPDSRQ